MIKITINTDNAAFKDDTGSGADWDRLSFQVAKVLSDLSRKFLLGSIAGPREINLLDSNGNVVGKCEFIENEEESK